MKTVVILGAGCSKGLGGLPADVEFLPKILEKYMTLSDGQPEYAEYQDEIDDLYFVLEAYKLFYINNPASFGGLLADCRLEMFWNEIDENYNRSKVVLHSQSIDSMFNRAMKLADKEDGKLFYYFKHYLEYENDLTQRSPYEYLFMFAGWQLRKKVAEIYSLKANDQVKRKYVQLLDKLKRISEGDELTFISFNYDTLLEQALGEYHYCGLYDTELKENTVNVIKPHGSVNWLYVTGEPITPFPDPISLDNTGYFHNNKKLYQHSIVGLVSNKIEFDKEKQLDDKVAELYGGRLLPILTKVLSEAERLVVIGYSFPMTDVHVRRAFSNAQPKNMRDAIYVTKMSEDEVSRYGKRIFNILGLKRFTWNPFCNGVEAWLKHPDDLFVNRKVW